MRARQQPNKAVPSLTMDEETAKEVEDLHGHLAALLHRKRKREEDASEVENKRLKRELAHQKQLSAFSKRDYFMADQRLEELDADNERLKNELEQQVLSKVFLQQTLDEKIERQARTIEAVSAYNKHLKKEAEHKLVQEEVQRKLTERVQDQERTVKTLQEGARLSSAENRALRSRLKKLEKYEFASEKAVLDLKSELHLAIEAVFELNDNVILVSQHIKNLKAAQG
jgi:ribosomal protein S16